MHKFVLGGLFSFLCATSFAAPYVTNVVAKQWYPWNGKVDIAFEIVGDPTVGLPEGKVADLSVTMTDKEKGKTYTATNLMGDTEPTEGKHNVVWDMTAQGIEIYSAKAVFAVSYLSNDSLYRVIDVSEGPTAERYPVTFLNAVPKDGWSDEYKTEKIVLRRIDGTNGVYYAGVFQITQAQWGRVVGGFTNMVTDAEQPAYYNEIRGDATTYDWPTSTEVDPTSFIGKLRQRTGLTMLDLPSEAEWEFAARAGATTEYICGDSATGLSDYAWYKTNSRNMIHSVGSLQPNAWGLYDVIGNTRDWCLDRYYGSLSYRVLRGGGYDSMASGCTFAYRDYCEPSDAWAGCGFRLFCRPESN